MVSHNMNRTVWRRRVRPDDQVEDDQIRRILELLDPVFGTECARCGREKRPRAILCDGCSTECPDLHCRGDGRKQPSDDMCRHCANWLRELDVDHEGAHKFRDGFFVYQLDSGYVGMTYNPSKRQKEHEAQRYVASRNDIERPGAYFAKMMEDWPEEYRAHWSRVRQSDPNFRQQERAIRWLSPIIETRESVYRCEWALRAYSPQYRNVIARFDIITSLSSAPVLELMSSDLLYDLHNLTWSFGLEWRLSSALGPSQIVPVANYQLERFDPSKDMWQLIDSNIAPGENEESVVRYRYNVSSNIGTTWRVRAINAAGIPGPWSELSIQDAEMAEAIRQVLRVSDVRCSPQHPHSGNLAVDVGWNGPDSIAGMTFEVERCTPANGNKTVFSGSGTSCVDRIGMDSEYSYECEYRVRGVLFGVKGHWSTDSRDTKITVPGVLPGTVSGLQITCTSAGTVELRWGRPDHQGDGEVTRYDIDRFDHDWKPIGNIPSEGTEVRFVETELVPNDHKYRVRAGNRHGVGPWIEIIAPIAEMERLQQSHDEQLRTQGLWDSLVSTQETGKPVTANVIGTDYRGLLVQWEGLSGFVLFDNCMDLRDPNKHDGFGHLVGQSYDFAVARVQPHKQQFELTRSHSDP